jgi:hypothetical protein
MLGRREQRAVAILAVAIGLAFVACSGGEDSSQPTDPDVSTTAYYHDGDGDTFGDPSDSTLVASSEDRPADHVTDNSDCDDSDADVNPDADEIPDDGIDNDCSGEVDETSYWYEDGDGDGYGNPAVDSIAESQPAGYVADDTDCDDSDAAVHPGAQEAPTDGLDNDCDGEVDETSYWYEDADGDGYGNPAVETIAESQPTGYVSDNTDCDDSDPNVNPGADEISDDGIDNDCDGEVDETS